MSAFHGAKNFNFNIDFNMPILFNTTVLFGFLKYLIPSVARDGTSQSSKFFSGNSRVKNILGRNIAH